MLDQIIYTINYNMNDEEEKYQEARAISNILLFDHGIDIEALSLEPEDKLRAEQILEERGIVFEI